MSQPYSADLRERVLVACERGDLPQVEIARRFQVCPATISTWRRQEREEGRRAAKPHSGGVPSRLDAAAVEVRIASRRNIPDTDGRCLTLMLPADLRAVGAPGLYRMIQRPRSMRC